MSALGTLFFIALVLAVYWLPSILAYVGRHPDPVPVVLINAVLGWTVLGWAWALALVATRSAGLRASGRPRPAAGGHVPDCAAAGRRMV